MEYYPGPLPSNGGEVPPPPPPPAPMTLEIPGHLDNYNGEPLPIIEQQQKRWAIIDRLRRRERRERKVAQREKARHLDYLKDMYSVVAHIMIDAVTDLDKDPKRRERHRESMERRMHVRPAPRLRSLRRTG